IRAEATLISDSDFTSGLDPWSTQGSVTASNGVAIVTDSGVTRSLLFQPVTSGTGAFTLSFDFRNALSADVPVGALADTLFASIYFADSLAALDVPNGVFADSISLFDLDSAGAFNLVTNGSVGTSSKGTDW